jgi:hypothetical protein
VAIVLAVVAVAGLAELEVQEVVVVQAVLPVLGFHTQLEALVLLMEQEQLDITAVMLLGVLIPELGAAQIPVVVKD